MPLNGLMYGLDDIMNARGMHIGHLNDRSMVNKWDLLKAQFGSSNLHVLRLSETWLNKKLPSSLFQLSNDYVFLRNDRNWSELNDNTIKKGGGIGLYIHCGLDFSETSHSNLDTSSRDIEMQWVSIKQPHTKLILIGNVYRPPQGNMEKFTQVLENSLLQIDMTKTELYIMGDFNIDMMDSQNMPTKDFKSFIKTIGLRQIIKEPTRCTIDRSSCLDLVLTNSDLVYKVGAMDLNISDHSMILLTRKRFTKIKKKCAFIGRSYRNYDKNIFQNNIENSDLSKYDKATSAEEKWMDFENITRSCIDKMCPTKSFRIKQEKEPWITPHLIELIKDKDLALKRAKKSKNPNSWADARHIRNSCTRRLREARAEFIRQNLDNNVGNQKQFWRNIQDVLPNSKSKTENIKLINKDMGTPIEEKDTSKFINDFFVNIGPNLAKHCNEPWSYEGTQSQNEVSEIETNFEEITKLCKDININKASCIDNLSSEVLRDAMLIVPDRIAQIFNTSFNTGSVPDAWKIAKGTPLQKPGDKNDVNNLRPVSLLPLPSKLIEKIVHKRIYNHCDEHGLFDERQTETLNFK